MNFKTVLFKKDNYVAKIALNVPKTRNAFTFDMEAELREIFEQIRDDDSAKVVVVTGNGNSFCSGGDIGTMEGLTPTVTRIGIKRGQRLIKAMLELEKPIIGAINGIAAGAGVSIALACDMIVASNEAKFGMTFTKIGAIPDLGLYYLLPVRVGIARTKELMFTGSFIDAREAERIGLINRVVPPELLEEEVFSLAERLVNGPSQSYAMIKAALNRWPANLETFLEIESTMQAVAFSSQDFHEGRRAFLEKRNPDFLGKRTV